MNDLKDLLYKVFAVIAVIFLIRILWGLLKYLIPIGIVLFVLYVLFGKKEEVKTEKWYEGSTSDSYYQKEAVIRENEAIDVEVKVKRSENDPSGR